MIIMSFVEMMVGTAQNIIKLFVAAALYRKLLKVHLIFWFDLIWFDLIWFGHYNTAAWDGITLALCPSVCVVVIWFFRFFLTNHRFLWKTALIVWQIFFFNLFHDVDNKSD